VIRLRCLKILFRGGFSIALDTMKPTHSMRFKRLTKTFKNFGLLWQALRKFNDDHGFFLSSGITFNILICYPRTKMDPLRGVRWTPCVNACFEVRDGRRNDKGSHLESWGDLPIGISSVGLG
jgi:hypothetical protein